MQDNDRVETYVWRLGYGTVVEQSRGGRVTYQRFYGQASVLGQHLKPMLARPTEDLAGRQGNEAPGYGRAPRAQGTLRMDEVQTLVELLQAMADPCVPGLIACDPRVWQHLAVGLVCMVRR